MYKMNILIKIFFIFFIFLSSRVIIANSSNKVIFTIDDIIYTSIDFEKRINFVNLREGRIISDKENLLKDFVSALLFDYDFNEIGYEFENINKEIDDEFNNMINKYNNTSNDDLKYLYSKLTTEELKKNLRYNIQRKKIIEYELNKIRDRIFEESLTEINNIYDINIHLFSIQKNQKNYKELEKIGSLNQYNISEFKEILNNNKLDFIYKEKQLNFTESIDEKISDSITSNKDFFEINNKNYLILGKIVRNFKYNQNLKFDLIQIIGEESINKEILTCNNIKSFNKNNKKFEIIYNENLKHTDLNEVIKNNLIKIDDYLYIKNEQKHIYIILCGIIYDDEVFKEININNKINFLATEIEKEFIKEKSVKYKLNYL